MKELILFCSLPGGYEVASSIDGFDFQINVCRGITADSKGQSHGCPKDSAMCRIDKNLHVSKDIGNIRNASNLSFSETTGDIILVYNATNSLDTCREKPMTKITFRCPKESVSLHNSIQLSREGEVNSGECIPRREALRYISTADG